jgi:hypothetical protein
VSFSSHKSPCNFASKVLKLPFTATMQKTFLTLIFLLLASMTATLHAQSVPTKITYQGILYESGSPFTGTKNFVFTIGTWTETQNNVAVTGGRYSVILGSVTPLSADLFKNSSNLVLSIQANGTNLTPNIDLVTVPYAMKSEYANEAGNTATFGGNAPSHYLNYQNLTNTPKVAFLKDIKGATVAGGTFTAGAWQLRELNTVEGDASFVSLNTNQFVLSAGTYMIEAEAPAYSTDRHIAKLRNVTDNADVSGGLGTLEFSTGDQTRSKIYVTFAINASKVFEIRHYCTATTATTGFGYNVATGLPSVPVGTTISNNVVYTTVKITKLQ